MDTTQNTGTSQQTAPARPNRSGINTPHDKWMMAGTCTGLAIGGLLFLSMFFVYYPGWLRFVIFISTFPLMIVGALTATAAHAVYSRVREFVSGRYW